MATYTLTTDLIENLRSSDFRIIGELLHVLTNTQNNNKIALDKDEVLLTYYANAEAQINDELKEEYHTWLKYLSNSLTQNNVIERTDVQINAQTNDPFLEVASAINGGQRIIVYSTECKCPYQCANGNIINHNGVKIRVLDKDEAVGEMNNKVTNIYIQKTTGKKSPIYNGSGNTIN